MWRATRVILNSPVVGDRSVVVEVADREQPRVGDRDVGGVALAVVVVEAEGAGGLGAHCVTSAGMALA
jgi:hypothetical protein